MTLGAGQGGDEPHEQPGVDGGLVLLHEGGVQSQGNQQVQVSSALNPIKPVELSTTEVVLGGEEQLFLLEVPRLLEGRTLQGLRLVSFKTSQV